MTGGHRGHFGSLVLFVHSIFPNKSPCLLAMGNLDCNCDGALIKTRFSVLGFRVQRFGV